MTRIAIVGAGVIGAAIAYELSLIPDFQVILLESQQGVTGATKDSLGVLMGIMCRKNKGRAWTLRQVSMNRFEALIGELERKTGRAIAVNRQGIVLWLKSESDLEKWQNLYQKRKKHGYNLEYWSQSQLIEHCPHITDEQILAALYSPDDRQVDPIQFTESLITAASSQGVDYRPGVRVEAFKVKENSQNTNQVCHHLETNQGCLEVEQVIITAGFNSFALTQKLQQPIPLEPVIGQAIALKLAQPLGDPAFQPVITGEDWNLVPNPENEYIIGATLEFPDAQGLVKADPMLLEKLYQRAIAVCPDLATGKVIRTWSGERPRPTEEAAPVLHPLAGYDNILVATGHYRNGILLAPATALWVRDYLIELTQKNKM
ncbi:MAG: NAD(P)/FAD-dependent oxidoreductase [Microcystaceae cyanobacterium]